MIMTIINMRVIIISLLILATIGEVCMMAMDKLLESDIYNTKYTYTLPDGTSPMGMMKYKLLSIMDNHLFVGGKNSLTILEINETTLQATLSEEPTCFEVCDPNNDFTCEVQKKEEACQNYIRVISQIDSTTVLVCGSNAIFPRCYQFDYELTNDNKVNITRRDSSTSECMIDRENYDFNQCSWDKNVDSGVGFTPFDWDGEMTHLFKRYPNGTYQVFSGGSQKINKRESVMCHIHSDAANFPTIKLCTLLESEFLNKADYVGKPIQRNGKTYIFYREFAEEYINHGKAIYSRVGRFCDIDTGGRYGMEGLLTTFIKARLDCSISGDYDPFFFNELRDVYQSKANPDIIYAVFTTPDLSFKQSAVCVYNLTEIERMMNEENFRGQDNINDLWLPERNFANRPGVCGDQVPSEFYETYQKYHLIDPLVTNKRLVDNTPTPMLVLPDVVYTSIVVEDKLTDQVVLIIGTDNGTVLMASMDSDMSVPHIFNKYVVSEDTDEVTELSVHYVNNTASIYGTTHGQVFGFAIEQCRQLSCLACTSPNPYCRWNTEESICSACYQTENCENQPSDPKVFCTDGTGVVKNFYKVSNGSVELKFAHNCPQKCLKPSSGECRFYLIASLSNTDENPEWTLTSNNQLEPMPTVTYTNITGVLYKRLYYTIVSSATEQDMVYTFQLSSSSYQVELSFEVYADITDLLTDCKAFQEDIKIYDEDTEMFRYGVYKWTNKEWKICDSRKVPQEKSGTKLFPIKM